MLYATAKITFCPGTYTYKMAELLIGAGSMDSLGNAADFVHHKSHPQCLQEWLKDEIPSTVTLLESDLPPVCLAAGTLFTSETPNYASSDVIFEITLWNCWKCFQDMH